MALLGVCLSSGQLDQSSYHSWPPDAATEGGTSDQGQPDPKADQMSS